MAAHACMALPTTARHPARCGTLEMRNFVGRGRWARERERARGASRPQSKRSKSDCLIKNGCDPWTVGVAPGRQTHVALASSVPIWPGQPIRRGPRGQRGRQHERLQVRWRSPWRSLNSSRAIKSRQLTAARAASRRGRTSARPTRDALRVTWADPVCMRSVFSKFGVNT
jgi:hypothetical protein